MLCAVSQPTKTIEIAAIAQPLDFIALLIR